jgi:hypothetical protein
MMGLFIFDNFSVCIYYMLCFLKENYMIINATAYGISLTDEFGGTDYPAHQPFTAFVQALRDEFDWKYPEWITDCPSVEDRQLVLGFSASINKKTDFAALDKKWHEMMEKLPQKYKDLLSNIDLPEPDVQEMSGEC